MNQDLSTTNATDGFQLEISYDLKDRLWDDFVLKTPGGNQRQTSLWAQAQHIRGWNPLRIMLTRDGKIQAGAQILFRNIPILGRIGYLTRGPVCDFSNVNLTKVLFKEIRKICRRNRIFYLVLTLPVKAESFVPLLPEFQFQVTRREYGEPASVVIDLTQDKDNILARMTKDKRKTIHRVERRQNLILREGTKEDIESFYRLHKMSSQRNGFPPFTEEYYRNLWEVFAPGGFVKLFLSELDGIPQSGIICFAFRDTVTAYVIGWSGENANLYPNDAVYWESILWSKAHGYHYFDFGGIQIDSARAAVQHLSLPVSQRESANRFKLDYGGTVFFYPDDYDSMSIPFLNKLYRHITPWLELVSVTARIPKWFLKKPKVR